MNLSRLNREKRWYHIRTTPTECLLNRPERRWSSAKVIEALADVMGMKDVPEHIRLDDSPEFVARDFRNWLAETGAKTLYIQPGSLWENSYCGSFDSKLWDEFLNGEIFDSMKELHLVAERWRIRQGFLNDPQPLRRAELPALGRDWCRRRIALAAANDPSILASWTSLVRKPRMPTHTAQVPTAFTGILGFRGQKEIPVYT